MFREYKIFLNPKSNVFQFAILVLAFSLFSIASSYNPMADFADTIGNKTFYDAIYIFGILHLIFFLYTFAAKKFLDDKFFNPLNLYITLNIIFVVLKPDLELSIILIPLCFFITIVLNKLTRYKGQPVFNPAAFGIFISFIFFYLLTLIGVFNENIFVSWWGANVIKGVQPFEIWQVLLGLICIALFIYFGIKNNKGIYGLSFIMLFLLIQGYTFVLNKWVWKIDTAPINEIFLGFIIGNLFYFGLIMLIEPKTSPTNRKQQFLFGAIAAVIYSLLLISGDAFVSGIFGELIEIVVILIMNFMFFSSKLLKSQKNIQS